MKHIQEAYDLHARVEDRSAESIDRFFVLVAQSLVAKEAATEDAHTGPGSPRPRRSDAAGCGLIVQ